ncbi:MAG TPA: hypothetical protein VEO54_05150 [Thermoanaerobaculia bacterium]|nr:hypothetical protein [Thermoanaerobaculia bacterium]
MADRLEPGQTLTAGQTLVSQNGLYLLILQHDGNLVLYKNGFARWATHTGTGTRAVMQSDGNFVLYGASGSVWATNSSGHPGAYLLVQNDGNVVVYAPGGRALFSSDTVFDRLLPGESLGPGGHLRSEDRRFVLILQHDGNLVLYKDGQPQWRSDLPVRLAAMQADGNFVLYDEQRAVWESATGTPGSQLVLQSDGNLVVYDPDGQPLWASGAITARAFVPGFRPSKSGFRFSNSSFPASTPHHTIRFAGVEIPIGDAKRGLCGGMVFAARDYWQAGRKPPDTDQPPTSGTLYDYLVARLYASFNLDKLPVGPSRYRDLMDPTLPDDQPFLLLPGMVAGRSWTMAVEEWPKIRADIDAGAPSPIALVTQKTFDVGKMGENHQVLAYGYDLDGTILRLYVYDPNAVAEDHARLRLDLSRPKERISVDYNVGDDEVLCFFKVAYTFRPPP